MADMSTASVAVTAGLTPTVCVCVCVLSLQNQNLVAELMDARQVVQEMEASNIRLQDRSSVSAGSRVCSCEGGAGGEGSETCAMASLCPVCMQIE